MEPSGATRVVTMAGTASTPGRGLRFEVSGLDCPPGHTVTNPAADWPVAVTFSTAADDPAGTTPANDSLNVSVCPKAVCFGLFGSRVSRTRMGVVAAWNRAPAPLGVTVLDQPDSVERPFALRACTLNW